MSGTELVDDKDAELVFEFWEGHHYEQYGPRQQEALKEGFYKNPRSQVISLAGGRYDLLGFDQILFGGCLQINTKTHTERHVRVRPPYRFPEGDSWDSVAEYKDNIFHFQYLAATDEWVPYPKELQKDLTDTVKSGPLPRIMFFDIDGRTCRWEGIQTLSLGKLSGLQETCVCDGSVRPIRIVPGPVPEGDYETAAIQKRMTCRLDPGGPATGSRFSRSKARFAFVEQRTIGCYSNLFAKEKNLPVEDGHEALMQAWIKCEITDTVELPGNVTVQHFSQIEQGGAGALLPLKPKHRFDVRHCADKPQWTPLKMFIPMPCEGALHLPAALEKDDGFRMGEYGDIVKEDVIRSIARRGADGGVCLICLSQFEVSEDSSAQNAVNPPVVIQLRCGHMYHGDCIAGWFNERRRCPVCHSIFGKIIGDQPKHGTMRWHYEDMLLPGHADTDSSIVIDFIFPKGRDDHGDEYGKRRCRSYLPGNSQGAVLLELFKVAFRRRVMFGLGLSLATEAYRPTFNIHIKTSQKNGAARHGYPDVGYFSRALEELAANGISRCDLPG